ncbi:MAG: tetrahydromethanopterin S-methyltransferase subunit H [Methanomassiliicoccales archaeon]
MFRYGNQQEHFRIGGIEFGGQPGERRTVLVASLFYPGHGAVRDRAAGKVDLERVTQAMDRIHQAGEETGTPIALALYAETPEAIGSYLDGVVDLTSLPLMIDSSSAAVRIAGVERAAEMGVTDRVIYNSLSAGTSEEEFEAIERSGLEAAIVLAFYPGNTDLKGKIYLLEDGAGVADKGLIDMARDRGISKPLLDMAVMSLEQNAGSALRAMVVAKAKWGLPTGCSLHNAVESWEGLRAEDRELYRQLESSSTSIAITAGADFVFCGPVERARREMWISRFADRLMEQALPVD